VHLLDGSQQLGRALLLEDDAAPSSLVASGVTPLPASKKQNSRKLKWTG
jgi:hypothetical protein